MFKRGNIHDSINDIIFILCHYLPNNTLGGLRGLSPFI